MVVVVPPMPPHPEILGLGRLLASKCLHWQHPRENSNQTLLHSGLGSLAPPMVGALARLWSAGRAIRGWSLAALTQRSAYARLRRTSTREEHSGTVVNAPTYQPARNRPVSTCSGRELPGPRGRRGEPSSWRTALPDRAILMQRPLGPQGC